MELPVIVALASLLFFLALGLPIYAAMGLSIALAMFVGGLPPELMIQKLFLSLDSFPLLAVPFFIMSGELMQKGSMADALLRLSRALVGHVRGGMAHISVMTCLFYGALSGSGPATVAAVGGIMIPAMSRENYPKPFAAALNTTSGCLGVLIPPSVPLIIYGTQANVSIGDLFVAGILPGIFVGLALMGMCYWLCRRRGYGVPLPKATRREILAALWGARHALLVPFIVLGGIYGGVFTPTEAGATAVLYALLIESFVSRSLTWRKFYAVLKSTIINTSVIFIIVALAVALGQILLIYNTPQVITDLLSGYAQNKYLLLAIICGILLICGCFLDTVANIVLLSPLFMPVLRQAGVNDVHFGIVMITALAIGFITPPVGVNLFVACGISGMTIDRLSRAILPFLLLMLACLLTLAYVPDISLALIR